MAEETPGKAAEPATPSGAPQATVPFSIVNQYLRDLSVENPNAPMIYGTMKSAPEIGVNVNVEAKRLNDNNSEVVLSINVEAKAGERTAFVIELQYAALVTFAKELDQDLLQQILLVAVPQHLFPFARAIISSATIESGFPPLLISPIDFRQLLQRQQQAPSGAPEEGANEGANGEA